MDRDILLLLVGAGIALVSGGMAAVLQHYLSLREDRIKRERDENERIAREQREKLSVSVDFGPASRFSGRKLTHLRGDFSDGKRSRKGGQGDEPTPREKPQEEDEV